MKFELMNKAAGMCQRAGTSIKMHSPMILMVGGIVGVVTSAVLACRATLKVEEILNEADENVKAVQTVFADEANNDKYNEDDGKNDLRLIYIKTGVKLARLYLPAVALGALSIFSLVTSNRILCRRNAALAAAYAVIDQSFKDYRKRLISKYGEETDKELRYNVIEGTLDDVATDENGDEVKIETPVQVGELSGFARYYDKYTSEYCTGDESYDLMYVKSQQCYATDQLRVFKYLYLNDVLKPLGLKKSVVGNVVGWFYDKDKIYGDRFDDFVDFEITPTYRKLENGEVIPTIRLNFNVGGSINEIGIAQGLITAE